MTSEIGEHQLTDNDQVIEEDEVVEDNQQMENEPEVELPLERRGIDFVWEEFVLLVLIWIPLYYLDWIDFTYFTAASVFFSVLTILEGLFQSVSRKIAQLTAEMNKTLESTAMKFRDFQADQFVQFSNEILQYGFAEIIKDLWAEIEEIENRFHNDIVNLTPWVTVFEMIMMLEHFDNMENTSANPELEDEPVQNDDPVQENEVIALDGLGRTMILICMVYDGE
ncbi:unnamed protein product [Caenorhabditis angaria]|uniref:Uncharacterized protein n=1 Tax=Caenorhabditis angaria TaxID=860376 RepID=A0A9P1N8P7_9PELO|nr:unnamed protein product [Caenorhabditis angaria]